MGLGPAARGALNSEQSCKRLKYLKEEDFVKVLARISAPVPQGAGRSGCLFFPTIPGQGPAQVPDRAL